MPAFWGSQTLKGPAGPPPTWCCGGSATSSCQLKERNVTRDQGPKWSNLPPLRLCLSSSLRVNAAYKTGAKYPKKAAFQPKLPSLSPQWSNMSPPRWRARCRPTPSRPTRPPGTLLPAETTLPWSTSCTLPSPSTARGRSTASLCEPSESTWETVMFTAYITWSGWGSRANYQTLFFRAYFIHRPAQNASCEIQQTKGCQRETLNPKCFLIFLVDRTNKKLPCKLPLHLILQCSINFIKIKEESMLNHSGFWYI